MKNVRSIYELLSIVESIEGWISTYEQIALLHLPSMADHFPGAIVEIGSFKGKSTAALALGSSLLSSRKRPVYAIDPFVVPPYEEFENNMKMHGLDRFVIPIKKHSYEACEDCPESIAALFIDGDHNYESVRRDIADYIPRVVKGGIAAFHDYSTYWPGVVKAVDELCGNKEFKIITIYDNLLFVRKL